MKLSNIRKQKGFTAIELMVVLIVTIAALSVGGQALNDYTDGLVQQSTSDHVKSVSDAAVRYIKDNNAAVLAVATSTTPATITVAMLQGAGYLPASFTAVNPYGQSYSVLALEPAAGQLQTLIVTTGGETISELGIRRIAQQVGARGGYISSTNTANAVGSYSGWTMPLAGYGTAPGAGHLAVALFFQDGSLVSDFVYRNAVAGHPELNTMNTPLVMNSVQTSGAACATTGAIARDAAGAILACQGGTWKSQGSAYWKDPVANYASLPASGDAAGSVRMTLDTGRAFMWTGGAWSALAVDQNGNLTVPGTLTAAGGKVIAWNAVGEGGVLQLVGANGTSIYMESLNGKFRLVNSPWSAEIFSVDQSGNVVTNGRLTTNEYLQINGTATEGAACSPNGLVGRDTNGLLLSCQSGVWKALNKAPSVAVFTNNVTSTAGSSTCQCPAGTVRMSCGGSRHATPIDNCDESSCGYVGTVPIAADSCRTAVDAGASTWAMAYCYCASF